MFLICTAPLHKIVLTLVLPIVSSIGQYPSDKKFSICITPFHYWGTVSQKISSKKYSQICSWNVTGRVICWQEYIYSPQVCGWSLSTEIDIAEAATAAGGELLSWALAFVSFSDGVFCWSWLCPDWKALKSAHPEFPFAASDSETKVVTESYLTIV